MTEEQALQQTEERITAQEAELAIEPVDKPLPEHISSYAIRPAVQNLDKPEASYYKPLTHVADEQDEGRKLRDVLRKRVGISRRLWSKLKTSAEGVTVNGQTVFSSFVLTAGDLIELRMEEETSEEILPQPMELTIVFEDEHLLVLNKPAGVIVHPTTGHYANTLANGVVHYWQERGERCRFRPVNRLDEHTSGLVIVAKHPYAQQQLSVQMSEGTVEKKYRAYVYGVPPLMEGKIDKPIGRMPEDPHRRGIREDGQPSLTYYEVSATYPCGASSLDVRLGTGRTHQIRVHLGSVGCPLIGDAYYADPVWEQTPLAAQLSGVIGRQALHAALLSFRHPVTDKELTLEAKLPDDLLQLEEALKAL